MIQKISLNPAENILKGKLAGETKIAILLCDATNGAFSVDLLDAQNPDIVMIKAKKTDSSTNAITFSGINAQTIDGAASVAISTQYDTVTFVRDGSNWHRLGIEANPTFGAVACNTIDMPEIAAPSTPSANNLRMYNELIKGFSTLKYLDDGGMKREFMRDSVIVVKNIRGTTIAANRIVYATGSEDQVPTVNTAKADSAITLPAIGVTVETIANDAYGRVMQVGVLENINTSAFAEGDLLYVSDATAGIPTATKPVTPSLTQEIGTVLVSHASEGAIQIVARGLTGDEYGTAQNTFYLGNGNAGSKTLIFNAATNASIIWDEAKFDFGANNILTTGTIGVATATISRTDASPVLTINYGDTANTYDPQIVLQENGSTIWSIGMDTNNSNNLIITPNTSVRGKGDFVFDFTNSVLGIGITTPAGDATLQCVRGNKDNIFYFDDYSADTNKYSRINFRKSHNNTKGSRTTTLNNSYLGELIFKGVDSGGAWDYGAGMYIQQTAAAGVYVPTTYKFFTYSATAFNPNQLSLYHDGKVGMNAVFPPTEALHIGGNFRHSADSQYNYFGAANDSGITDDGAKMIFDCDVQSAGSRYFDFLNGNIYISGTQILTTQQSHIADADGTLGSATTTINAILSTLETHGLVASS